MMMRMTLIERTNAIGTLLREVILPRYNRPERMSDDAARAEITDMVADLNGQWPVTDRRGFDAIAERFHAELRRLSTAVTRPWPTIGIMLKALEAAKKGAVQAAAAAAPGEVLDWKEHARCTQIRTWLAGAGPVLPHFVTEERLRSMGYSDELIRMALAFIANPQNQGLLEDAK